MGSLLPNSMSHAPPEVQKGGWSVLKESVRTETSSLIIF
jgi:hypothetical protein